MPEEKNNSTTFLVVVLVIVIIITIGLTGLYFFTGPKGTPKFLKTGSQNQPPKIAAQDSESTVQLQTSIYEGFIQELTKKEKTIGDMNYDYVIGLVDKEDNAVPVWLSSEEYNNLKVYKFESGSQVEGTLADIKGGSYLKVTRSIPVDSQPEFSRVIIEIVY